VGTYARVIDPAGGNKPIVFGNVSISRIAPENRSMKKEIPIGNHHF